jgi:predicted 3-demethylubiquinone-9 3-methyltransferase (glyoxalase superfamily)
MNKITPFLWFENNEAEAAAKFYTSIFKPAKITGRLLNGDAGPGPKGSALTVSFTLFGQEFTALNGGRHDTFNQAVSFVVNCRTQKEVDYYWAKLSRGGKIEMCGWLRDKFGVSWQITPVQIHSTVGGKNPAGAARAMAAMMKMRKLDIRKLERAYRG